MAKARRSRSTRALWGRWALGAIALVFTAPLAARGLESAVVVGKMDVPPDQVEQALRQCAQHGRKMQASKCLDEYWVPRWLLDVRARKQDLSSSPALQHERRDILHEALIDRLAREVSSPTPREIDSFVQKHRRDFEKPLRVRLFRILVASEKDALEVLEELSPSSTLEDFRRLAREHSLDRATKERGGDLGFVWPDGSTDIPQVSADETLYEAAIELTDGEICREPVQEGEHFAVIWRRGSLPSQEVNASARERAALLIREQRTEQATARLLQKLESKVQGRDDSLLSKLRRNEATLFHEP